MVPFFNKDMNIRLLVEPIIPGLPSPTRVHETKTKQMDELGNHFVDLAQRNLTTSQRGEYPFIRVKVDNAQPKEKKTHIFPDTRSSTGAEHEHCFLHPQTVPLQPSFGPEYLGIGSEYIRVVVYNGAVDAHAIASWKIEPGNGCTAGRDDTGHCKADAWVETHTFVDACFQIAKGDGLSIRNGEGEGPFSNSGVNF